MKMTNLAMAVATTFLASTSAFAAQVYSGDGTSLAIGGYVDVGVGEYTSDDVKVHQVSPRINIEGKQEVGNGVTVDAKGEWSLNYLEGGESSFATRLGYIGASHDVAGRLVAGTQWSPYYDIAGYADQPIAFANDFLYSNQYNLGSARAEKMISYRNSLAISSDVAINFGLGWQGEQSTSSEKLVADTGTGEISSVKSFTKYDNRGQIGISADFAGFSLGYVYNGGDVGDVKAESHVVAAKFGSYGNGLYAALVWGSNEHFYAVGSDTVADSSQYEAIVAYGLENGVNVSVNYEQVDDDDANETLYSESAIQVEYTITPSLVTYAAYQFELDSDISASDLQAIGKDTDDHWSIGARYFF